LKNHDEPRAATTFPPDVHESAAVITFLSPGLKFFHQGSLRGERNAFRPISGRGPGRAIDQRVKEFYERLLSVLRHPAVRNGQWQTTRMRPCLGRKLDMGLASWLLPGKVSAETGCWWQ